MLGDRVLWSPNKDLARLKVAAVRPSPPCFLQESQSPPGTRRLFERDQDDDARQMKTFRRRHLSGLKTWMIIAAQDVAI